MHPRPLCVFVLGLLYSLASATILLAAGAPKDGPPASPVAAPAACPAPPPGATTQSQTQALFDAVNAFRVANGLPTAVYNQLLENAALAHSQDMSQNDFFSHIGLDGSTPPQRVVRAGYDPTDLAENLAAGHTSAPMVLFSWTQSAFHLENLLRPTLREIGIGYVYDPHDQPNVDLGGGQLGGPFCYYWTLNGGYIYGALVYKSYLPLSGR